MLRYIVVMRRRLESGVKSQITFECMGDSLEDIREEVEQEYPPCSGWFCHSALVSPVQQKGS